MEEFLNASALSGVIDVPLTNESVLKTSAKTKIYKAGDKVIKAHVSPLAFAREVFWYMTLQGTPFVPELFSFDIHKKALMIGYGSPSPRMDQSVFSSLCDKGIKHNQWNARHLVLIDGQLKMIDWTLATFVCQPSYTLGFFSCELDCPFHGSSLCTALASTNKTDRCTLDVFYGCEPSKTKTQPKVAVVWRGLLKGRMGKGLHSTPYTMASGEKVMGVDAFHPDLLGPSTRAIDQAGADLFVHGWTTDDTPARVVAKQLEPLKPVKVVLEPLTTSFSSIYGPLMDDKDRLAKEARDHPQSAYVHLTDTALQRWWSTWYTLYTGFSLIPDAFAYDLIVIHRPDMVIPQNLDYRRVSTDAVTILMHQNPNGYADARPGYHDWFLAGPPHLMSKLVNIYPALYSLFDSADHPEKRSSHPLIRQWCEDHDIPVVSLHYTQVRKIHFVNGLPQISSVQMHDPMDVPSVKDQRAGVHDCATLTIQGHLALPIVVNCLAYLPGIWRLANVRALGRHCITIDLELSSDVFDKDKWEWVCHCLGCWTLGNDRCVVKLRSSKGVQMCVV